MLITRSQAERALAVHELLGNIDGLDVDGDVICYLFGLNARGLNSILRGLV